MTPLVAVAPGERRAFAAAHGYLFLPGLLAAAEVAPLVSVVDAALAARRWGRCGGATDPALHLGRWDDARWHAFLGEVLPSPEYRALAAAPALVAALRDVLEGDVVPHAGDVCRVISPGDPTLTTPPHQDAAYIERAAGVWTAWVALHDCPRALGPLAVWPGSHASGVRAHAAIVAGGGVVGTQVPGEVEWAASDLALGDVVLFSALTVHKALDNATRDRLRVSVDYRYRRAA